MPGTWPKRFFRLACSSRWPECILTPPQKSREFDARSSLFMEAGTRLCPAGWAGNCMSYLRLPRNFTKCRAPAITICPGSPARNMSYVSAISFTLFEDFNPVHAVILFNAFIRKDDDLLFRIIGYTGCLYTGHPIHGGVHRSLPFAEQSGKTP